MADEFIPRWGGSVFDCKFCGAEGMQWYEVASNKWMPYDLINKKIHDCQNRKVNELPEIIENLKMMGFKTYKPRTISWNYALIGSNQTQTIYFLFRKEGVDFKIYSYAREAKVDEKGRLFTDGGELVRNYYGDNDIDALILKIASCLVSDTPIDESFTSGHGRSRQKQKPKSIEIAAKDEMQEIYQEFSLGDSEDVYLGDGVWLNSEGSLYDGESNDNS